MFQLSYIRILVFWGWTSSWGVGVVRFQNGVCTGADGLDGTCYTKRQCADINGIASGSCASNIGVCCVRKGLSYSIFLHEMHISRVLLLHLRIANIVYLYHFSFNSCFFLNFFPQCSFDFI